MLCVENLLDTELRTVAAMIAACAMGSSSQADRPERALSVGSRATDEIIPAAAEDGIFPSSDQPAL